MYIGFTHYDSIPHLLIYRVIEQTHSVITEKVFTGMIVKLGESTNKITTVGPNG